MVPEPRKASFRLILFFLVFLFSLTLMPARKLLAQICQPVDICTTNADCDDGNFCNGTETCTGTCGSDVTQSCCVCPAPPANGTPCGDDNVFCNGINVCADLACVPESDIVQNPRCGANGECADFCDEATDTCADPAGTPCTDDGVFCTTDACNGLGACISSPNDFLCDDGVNCTVNDVCAGGVCNGTTVQCDDAIVCTLDACNEPTGTCQFDSGQCECQSDADCDDSNPCTDEFCCLPGACQQGTPFSCIRSNNTDPCDDGFFCNGTDICAGGTCSVHSGDPCTGGGECDQTCDENGDNCFAPTGVTCDDGDILTVTQCDGGGKCATIETFSTQGSTLGCSLHTGGESRSDSGFWILFNSFAKSRTRP